VKHPRYRLGLPLLFSTGGYARSDEFMLQPFTLDPTVLQPLKAKRSENTEAPIR
jgi:hypothetical protein